VTEYPQARFTPPPGATDVLLVRHGQSAPARPEEPFPLLDGQGDPPLSPLGREQAAAVGRRLAGAGLDAVYVTTLRRTRETAQPLLDATGLEARVEPDLREVHLGEWEGGLFRRHVAEGHPLARRMRDEERWDVIPGAESAASLAERVRGALERIAAGHPGGRVAVVTHGGVIGQAMALATGSRPFAFSGADNASVSQLVLTADRWVLRRFNDTAHLADDLSRAAAPPT
jgi:2,3-bisphosphoglycerate-dependent phosphoglycerate mutase